MALVSARFIARRKATRLTSCSAIDWRDELRVELGALDLEDVDLDALAGHPVQVAAQRVDLRAGLADHDARARRVDVDLHLVGVLADRDVRQARRARGGW
jgi:hypothetical protein